MSYESAEYTERRVDNGNGRRYEQYVTTSENRPRSSAVDSKSRLRPSYRDDANEDRRDAVTRREAHVDVDKRDFYQARGGGFGKREYSNLREPAHERSHRPPVSPDRRRYKPSGPTANAPPRPSKILGVFGLSMHTVERNLYDIFSAFGQVKDIKMVYDNLTGKSRGFAFVYFESAKDATQAKAECDDGLEIDGRIVRVDYSLTQAPHPPTPGVYMGKFKRRHSGDDGRSYRPERQRRREYSRSPLESRRGPLQGGHNSYRSRRSPPIVPQRGSRRHGNNASRNYEYSLNGGSDGIARSRRRRTVSSSRSRSPPRVNHTRHTHRRDSEASYSKLNERPRGYAVGTTPPRSVSFESSPPLSAARADNSASPNSMRGSKQDGWSAGNRRSMASPI